MRRAFTLIELLVVVAIIGIIATSATVSFASGREGARLRGAARDIFATMRLARTKAFVTHQPCIVTYSSAEIDGELSGKVEVTSAKIFSGDARATATTLAGEVVNLYGPDEPPEDDRRAAVVIEGKTEEFGETSAGETVEDILFAPIGDAVMKGICIKVTVGDEDDEDFGDAEEERSKAKISVFSNVDYLVGKLRSDQEARKPDEEKSESSDAASADAGPDAASEDDRQERVDIVWGVNGCCKPHRVWVYTRGSDPRTGLLITVDRFGTARIASEEELADARGGAL